MNQNSNEVETVLIDLLEKREVDFFPLYLTTTMKRFPPRGLLDLTSKIQEGVLQSKEPEKDGWSHMSLHRLLNELIVEVSELLDAIQKLKVDYCNYSKTQVLLECADVQNYASMIQDKILEHPFDKRGR